MTALRIGDVARELDVTIPTVRFWSEEFRIPLERQGNQRQFAQNALGRLRLIKQLLYRERYTIVGAKVQYQQLISGNW
jgi:DNA-binding transcriptional MerR regulator